MPHDSVIVNTGRGAHLVEADRLAALDSGQISGAVLDVFEREPLPEESALWSRAGGRIAPPIGAFAAPEPAAAG